jgi:hypothetical protein
MYGKNPGVAPPQAFDLAMESMSVGPITEGPPSPDPFQAGDEE